MHSRQVDKLSLAGEGVDEVDGCGQATERLSNPPRA